MDSLSLSTEPKITDEEIDRLLNRHGADYEVDTIPTPNPFPNGGETGFYTSYRTDTGKVFAQGLKKGFTPIQNRDSMRILSELSKYTDVRLKHFFMFGGGKEIVAQIDLGTHTLDDGNKVSNYLSMINGHDGGHAMSVFDTPFLYWCKNQINGSLIDARTRKSIVSIRHSVSSTDKLDILMTSIRLAQHDFQKSLDLYHKLMNTPVNTALAYDIIDGFYPAKEDAGKRAKTIRLNKLDDIYTRYNSADQGRTAKETAWNLYNAVQGHLQHYGRDTESHQKSILIGSESKRAAKAMAFILSLTASQHVANALAVDEKKGIAIF